VKKGLEGSGAQLEIFYMDTKRINDSQWKLKAGELAKLKVASFKPDVVIATDDNAQAYFARSYANQPSPQIVFCGVNADPKTYGYPSSNQTGILERPHFIQSVQLLKTIVPSISTIAFITDRSETSNAVLAYIKTLAAPVRVFSYDQPETFREWQSLISQYQNTVDAIAINLYHTIRTGPGSQSMPPEEVMAWTMANNRKPTVGFYDFAVKDGILCAFAVSPEEQGLVAADMASQILAGKKATDLPMMVGQDGAVMVNKDTAKNLGIQISEQVYKE
jgi:ABC-type uncharacterized transport system substrate-binding protein